MKSAEKGRVWTSTLQPPAVAVWYDIGPDGSMRRFWNGKGWSAPVYVDDPASSYQIAKATSWAGDEPVTFDIGCYYIEDAVRGLVHCWTGFSGPPVRVEHFAETKPVDAAALLDAAAGHIRDRAATYDKPAGERSMGQTVAAFNAITGHTLQESEGWLLMELLKAVRDFTTPGGHADSQEDRIAYAALGAEARRAGR